MSMDDYDDAYAECLGCDQAIFALGGEDAQAQYVVLSNGKGRLHRHCRAAYEMEHGPVVCEDDEDDEAERRWVQRLERDLEDGGGDAGSASYRAAMIDAGRGHLLRD